MSETLREVTPADLDACYEIESTAYAGDEAASREKIEKRIRDYPQGFLVLERDGQVVGMINGGATDHVQLSDESFKELVGHDPAGRHLVIMSVAVHPAHQRQGYASRLLAGYIERMRALGKQGIYLICQQQLIGFYQGFGFENLGESDSQHGGLSWFEMSLRL